MRHLTDRFGGVPLSQTELYRQASKMGASFSIGRDMPLVDAQRCLAETRFRNKLTPYKLTIPLTIRLGLVANL